MEPNFYTETATVLNADADFRSLLKPSALLRYVEQVSADHARAFGMDDKFFQDHNVAFLVGKQALQFVRVPRRTEALTLTTRAEHSRRGAIKRITTVTDAAGKLVATVDCRWILVDLTGGHIMREPDWTVENFWNETVEGELSLLRSWLLIRHGWLSICRSRCCCRCRCGLRCRRSLRRPCRRIVRAGFDKFHAVEYRIQRRPGFAVISDICGRFDIPHVRNDTVSFCKILHNHIAAASEY